MDYEGLSHPQRQALAHRFEAALRLLDEHCRVYQYLLKRTVGPFVATPCEAPGNRGVRGRTGDFARGTDQVGSRWDISSSVDYPSTTDREPAE